MILETTTSEFYSDGFFGYGEIGDFSYFSFWHFLPIILLIGSIILTYIFKEKIKTFKYEKHIRFSLAFFLMIVEYSFYWRLIYSGTGNSELPNLLTKLPVQVCTWSAVLTMFMLLTESTHLFDYVAYVSLTLGLLPIATPSVLLNTGPRYFRYYQYWFEHVLPIYSVFYMMFIKNKEIRLQSIWKPFVLLIPGALLAIYLNNRIEGAYFFFLGNQGNESTLGSIMPSNIYLKCLIYFLGTLSVFLMEYGIYRLVIYIKNKKFEKNTLEEEIGENICKRSYFV